MNKIKNRMKKVIASNDETRVYKLTSDTETLDKIERMLTAMQTLGNVGASRDIRLFIDGDGAFRLDIKKEDGELVKSDFNLDDEEYQIDFD